MSDTKSLTAKQQYIRDVLQHSNAKEEKLARFLYNDCKLLNSIALGIILDIGDEIITTSTFIKAAAQIIEDNIYFNL